MAEARALVGRGYVQSARHLPVEAGDSLHAAWRSPSELQLAYLVVEAEAGLAQVALQRGEQAEACRRAGQVFEALGRPDLLGSIQLVRCLPVVLARAAGVRRCSCRGGPRCRQDLPRQRGRADRRRRCAGRSSTTSPPTSNLRAALNGVRAGCNNAALLTFPRLCRDGERVGLRKKVIVERCDATDPRVDQLGCAHHQIGAQPQQCASVARSPR